MALVYSPRPSRRCYPDEYLAARFVGSSFVYGLLIARRKLGVPLIVMEVLLPAGLEAYTRYVDTVGVIVLLSLPVLALRAVNLEGS